MLRRFSDGLDVRERGSKGDNKVFGQSHRKARMSFTKMRKASKKLVLRGWYRQIGSSVQDLLTLGSILDIQMKIVSGQRNIQNWNQRRDQARNIYFGAVLVRYLRPQNQARSFRE